jgi:hypothetical protein
VPSAITWQYWHSMGASNNRGYFRWAKYTK